MYAELSQRTVVYNLVGGKSVRSVTIRTNFTEAVSELTEDKRFVLCGAFFFDSLKPMAGMSLA